MVSYFGLWILARLAADRRVVAVGDDNHGVVDVGHEIVCRSPRGAILTAARVVGPGVAEAVAPGEAFFGHHRRQLNGPRLVHFTDDVPVEVLAARKVQQVPAPPVQDVVLGQLVAEARRHGGDALRETAG